MMALIPTAWKIGGIVFLVALVAGGYFAWSHHQRALGAAAVNLKNAEAVIAQREADARLNAVAVANLAQKLSETETKVVTTERVIYNAPRTTVCADTPAIRAAIGGLRDIYAAPAQAGNSPQPLGRMPPPGTAAGSPKR